MRALLLVPTAGCPGGSKKPHGPFRRHDTRFAGVPRANEPGVKASPDAMRVILAATDIVGEANTASMWFQNEALSAFRFKTAEQLVSEGRTEDVLAYLESLEEGAAG